MTLAEKLQPLLNLILKGYEEIRAVYIIDNFGKLIIHVIRSLPKSIDFNMFVKASGKIFKGLKKIEKKQIIGDFSYITAEYHDHGRITHIALGNYAIVIIGEYCPKVGGIRLVLARVREELMDILHK